MIIYTPQKRKLKSSLGRKRMGINERGGRTKEGHRNDMVKIHYENVTMKPIIIYN